MAGHCDQRRKRLDGEPCAERRAAVSVQQYDPNLAGKEWGWRRFGKRSGVSVLATRARWLGVCAHVYRDHWTLTLNVYLGLVNLWFRIPYRPAPKPERKA
jgi:hypothetical protein